MKIKIYKAKDSIIVVKRVLNNVKRCYCDDNKLYIRFNNDAIIEVPVFMNEWFEVTE